MHSSERVAFLFNILRSVLAEEARVRMDDALTVVDTLAWMRFSMSRVASLCIRVSVVPSVFGFKASLRRKLGLAWIMR